MANSNFIVQNGLTVGPLTIDAATGSISTTGTVSVSGLAVSSISKNDTSITINDTGTSSNITFVIDGVTEHVMTQYLTTLNGNLLLNTTGYLQVPVGTNAQRPGSASNGMMRYNSDITSFEGYYAGAWSSLGGVKSVDGKAYITAEASAGAGDDVIRVYAGDSGTSTQVVWASTSNVKVLPTTVSTSSTSGALQVAGGAGIAGALFVGGHVGVEGVTSTGATGTGKFVFDNAPTISGHPTIEGVTSTGATGTGKFVFDASPTISGHPTIEGVTSTGATGTGNFVFSAAPTLTGHPTIEGVTSTGATGTGNFVFSASPTLTGTVTAAAITASSTVQPNANATVALGGTSAYWGNFYSATATHNSVTVGGQGVSSTGAVTITNTTDNNGVAYTSGALQVYGGAGIAGNLYVQGNVYAGNLLSTTTTILEVNDPLVYLAASNPSNYNYEIGVYSHFGPTGGLAYQHTGLIRDHNDSTWKIFSNVAEPAGGVVSFTNAIYDKFKAGDIIASNTTASSSTTTGALTVAGGAGIAGATYIGGLLSVTGHVTVEGVTSTGATGTGKFVFDASPTISGHPTIEGVTSTGATGTGKFVFDNAPTLTGTLTTVGIVPSANVTYNVGSSSAWYNLFYGKAYQAQYADLAENYQADSNYPYGTVVMFGGEKEVTIADADTTAVAGVVSQNPAHLMNGGLSGSGVVPLALQGRVPCNVIGPIKKGDMMVSAGFGYAKASANPQIGQVIGKALSDFTGAKGQIEVVVGRV